MGEQGFVNCGRSLSEEVLQYKRNDSSFTNSYGNTRFYFDINEWAFEKIRGVQGVLL